MRTRIHRWMRGVSMIVALILVTCGWDAGAHTQSSAFLMLRFNEGNLTGEWHLALRDLEDAVGLDSNDDGLVTWDELRSRKDAVCAYALSRLQIRDDAFHG